MKQEIKTKWIDALRSGDYKQAHGVLGYKYEDGRVENCCLGVLCDLAVQAGVIEGPGLEEGDYGTLYYEHQSEVLPDAVMDWAELGESYNPLVPLKNQPEETTSLAELNDGEGYADHEHSFDEIADIIEEHL